MSDWRGIRWWDDYTDACQELGVADDTTVATRMHDVNAWVERLYGIHDACLGPDMEGAKRKMEMERDSPRSN